ncbi:MAG TPA: ribonuclease PH [Deltaproteobacteria bacterium]|nr:ribonuclease PH [Deltaproteobacteria bacterium]
MRNSGRKNDEMRQLRIRRDFLLYPKGSVLIELGDTRVICTASLENGVPPFLRDTGRGWLTAEYSMLPMSTPERNMRESSRGRIGGRTHEIQRLIGRSLRAITDLNSFGERTMYIDCDVIQADGGTRTASITGSFVAMIDAFRSLRNDGIIDRIPVAEYVAAVSAGIVDGEVLLDLDYREDSQAEVDMNIIMTRSGRFIEVQGTAEQEPFSRDDLEKMMDVALKGITELTDRQIEILGDLN